MSEAEAALEPLEIVCRMHGDLRRSGEPYALQLRFSPEVTGAEVISYSEELGRQMELHARRPWRARWDICCADGRRRSLKLVAGEGKVDGAGIDKACRIMARSAVLAREGLYDS